MSKDFYAQLLSVWPENELMRFMLENSRDYTIGPDSFAGPRDPPRACFMNAARLAFKTPALTYVEGKVSCHLIPIDHAWCVDQSGIVVDPTLTPTLDLSGYFGVPLKTEYVRRAVIKNRRWGLLDIMSARKTLPLLIQMGLDAGQQWVIDGKRQPRRNLMRRTGK